jgi:hypothetical protein
VAESDAESDAESEPESDAESEPESDAESEPESDAESCGLCGEAKPSRARTPSPNGENKGRRVAVKLP